MISLLHDPAAHCKKKTTFLISIVDMFSSINI